MALDLTPYLPFFLLICTAIPLCSDASSSLRHHPLTTTLRQQQPTSGGGGGAVAVKLWCVAKNNAEDSALQSALDWACGAGGADCRPIQQGGACYDPADIRRTASYAFNDYFLKNGMTEDSCNFDNTAALISLDPSHSNCKFPSSLEGKSGRSTTMVGGPPMAEDTTSRGAYVGFGIWGCGWTLIVIHLLLSSVV